VIPQTQTNQYSFSASGYPAGPTSGAASPQPIQINLTIVPPSDKSRAGSRVSGYQNEAELPEIEDVRCPFLAYYYRSHLLRMMLGTCRALRGMNHARLLVVRPIHQGGRHRLLPHSLLWRPGETGKQSTIQGYAYTSARRVMNRF